MLRIHLLQAAYNLGDPRMEDLLLENSTARKFVGLNLMDRTPDESTILQFRHLLEKHELGAKILETINKQFLEAGLKLSTGRIVDASFIEAPNSTKNKEHKRDPEMASGKKGNVWHTSQRSDFPYSVFSNLLAANSISCCLRTASPQGIDAQASQGSVAPLTERSDETCSVEQFSSADREYSSAGRTTLDREYRSAPFSS